MGQALHMPAVASRSGNGPEARQAWQLTERVAAAALVRSGNGLATPNKAEPRRSVMPGGHRSHISDHRHGSSDG